MRANPIIIAILLSIPILLYSGALDPVADLVLEEPEMDDTWRQQVQGEQPHNATFAGGCFWCIEAAYEGREGVSTAISGYAGGDAARATYDQVLTGTTDHREAVRVRYYPSLISYEELLDVFWRSIDPTDAGGQFTDRGPQYTTAIYAHTVEQYRQAVTSKHELNESGRFEEPIVTTVTNYTTFFRAEDYHQNYSRRNTARYKAYETASGRSSFTEERWDDE
jgi:peptide methionine sulfoxide reductase msrA/msrB